jgi:hypothetical protein
LRNKFHTFTQNMRNLIRIFTISIEPTNKLIADCKYADLIPHILCKSVEFIPQFVIFA